MIPIFLDDIRDPPNKEWMVARTATHAYYTILGACQWGEKIILSLDHDLGGGTPTGYDLLNWIERDIQKGDLHPKIFFEIHSANPVGRDNMKRAIREIEKLLDENN